jgi:hypothetical protein
MHPRHHLLISTLAGLAVRRRRGAFPWAAWVGSLIADLDHLAWYAVRTRSLDPQAAWRYFRTDPTETPNGVLPLHHPLTALLLGLGGRHWQPLTAFGWGLIGHCLLDGIGDLWQRGRRRYEQRRREQWQRFVVARAGGRCQHCGRHGPLELHHRIPEALGGRYHPANLLALCPDCHDRAHGRG